MKLEQKKYIVDWIIGFGKLYNECISDIKKSGRVSGENYAYWIFLAKIEMWKNACIRVKETNGYYNTVDVNVFYKGDFSCDFIKQMIEVIYPLSKSDNVDEFIECLY